MILPRAPHRWNLDPRQAMAVQRRMASQVIENGELGAARRVAGLDAAFSSDGSVCVGVAVVWDRERGEVLERAVARRRVCFPYVPGLLSFREAPALLAALRGLKQRPEVLMCDGQGRAHPRRFGLACHLGLLCGLPAVGCAKSLLVGTHGLLGGEQGDTADLEVDGQCLGRVVRTRAGVRPVVVSIGHLTNLEEAVKLVLGCVRGYRLPEPTRLADHLTRLARCRS